MDFVFLEKQYAVAWQGHLAKTTAILETFTTLKTLSTFINMKIVTTRTLIHKQ